LGKRLTEEQKEEIIKLFASGVKIDDLSIQFNCTKFTISRNIKKKIGEEQYNSLLIRNKLNKLNNNKSNIQKIEKQDQNKILKNNIKNSNKTDYIQDDINRMSEFIEITPLNFDIDHSTQKDLTSVSITDVNLPNTVYMIVDKKVELEIKYLKDYPKWNFLSQDELKRKTIEIYYDLKTAKSFCQKEQKVIKVPNTNIFKLVAPILNSRGISRIISAENLIAL
tara:strand:- start:112 stop:780 length:669 start_codon:yes stop_codon:yes gene_type:complete